jgi:SAM-dependent methyltransferase
MKPISLYEFGVTEDLVRRIQRRFVEHFRGCGPVLDIGCGRGVFVELLTAAGIKAMGLDHSQEAITACEAKGLTVYEGDASQYLQSNPGQFGGIFCSHVIEHMDYATAIAFLERCHAALRPGGKLLEVFWPDPTHVRPYPRKLLRTMLDAVGFQILVDEQYLGSWKMVGRRHLPAYLFRRLLLGRYFGRPNTMMLAKKVVSSMSTQER